LRDEAPLGDPARALVRWASVEARGVSSSAELVRSFGRMLRQAGVPLHRVHLPLRARHPLVRVAGWQWRHTSKGDHVFAFSIEDSDAAWRDQYERSPYPLLIDQGVACVRRRLLEPACPDDFGVLAELRQIGATDFLALAGELREGERVGVTFTSRGPDGFSESDVETLQAALPLLLVHLELHLARELAGTVARTYIGRRTGSRVVDGDIRRGEVQRIEAVVGFCDLRGFTAASAVRAPEDVTALLNAWFDAIAAQVDATGGEILKFIGDAALVVWPVESDPRDACARAVRAARELAVTLPPGLRGGFSLHRGEVAYGNIGAADRLDFTVIGAAVNLASRIEGLCAAIGVPWLVSSAVAEPLDEALEDYGVHALKGIAEPVRVWGPPRSRGS
jgi:adenylate cyclase